MSSIVIVHGLFCREEKILPGLVESLHLRKMTADDAVGYACKASILAEDKIRLAFSAKTSVFNRFTHEKERAMAHLKLVVAEKLVEDDLLLIGEPGLLIPRGIKHVLRVCLISRVKERVRNAVGEGGLTEKEAVHRINQQEIDLAALTGMLYETKDPWNPGLYDMVLPMDKIDVEEAIRLIEHGILKPVVQPTEESRRAVQDFLLAAQVEVALAREGHIISVEAKAGRVTLTINKQVLMLSRLEEELKGIVNGVKGVKSAYTQVGKEFHQADIYRKFDFQAPSKVLLVDDEREFVQTLSERLEMRELGSVIAYNGQSALDLIESDEPEVMILDIKMPGIDGIEVLRRVKDNHPKIEVIILTGHGLEEDKKICMALGAFAYLHKPVDIELLSKTLKDASKKAKGEGSNS